MMGKPIKCRLRLHGKFKEIDGGAFNSIAQAKQWISTCWDGPYTIEKLK